MSRTRGRDTLPERLLRSELHRRGLRFRKDARPEKSIRRTVDVLFPRAKVVVLVDGCFWHGCPEHYVPPKTRAAFWQAKIDGNRSRDIETTKTLTDLGWTVVRLWEHKPVVEAADLVERVVRSRTGG